LLIAFLFLFFKHKDHDTMAKRKPVHEIRVGLVRAAIWENDTQNGTRHNVTFSRLYRDSDGQWQDSSSFGREDLPLLQKVSDRAHSWIYDHGQKPAPTPQEPNAF